MIYLVYEQPIHKGPPLPTRMIPLCSCVRFLAQDTTGASGTPRSRSATRVCAIERRCNTTRVLIGLLCLLEEAARGVVILVDKCK